MVIRWIVTREPEDAGEELELLRARGAVVSRVPCIETVFGPWPWRDDAGLTLFTSRRAVAAWRASGHPVRRCAALEPSTSRACRAAGLTPELEVRGGVVELAAALARHPERPSLVRYPTSDAGLRSLEQETALATLSEFAEVDRRVVYETRAPAALAGQLSSATGGPWSVLFASPSAVKHFFEAVVAPAAPQQVVCHGASTARVWNELRPPQWPHAVAATDLSRLLHEVKT